MLGFSDYKNGGRKSRGRRRMRGGDETAQPLIQTDGTTQSAGRRRRSRGSRRSRGTRRRRR